MNKVGLIEFVTELSDSTQYTLSVETSGNTYACCIYRLNMYPVLYYSSKSRLELREVMMTIMVSV